MECNFCKDNVKAFDVPRKAHLVLHKDAEDHIHVHGDIHKQEDIAEMLDTVESLTGVVRVKGAQPRKEIVFRNKQRIGDMLVFTCAIRDFKKAFPDVRVNVVSTAPHIWDHNPYIDRTLTPTEENTVKIGPGALTDASNRLDWHFTNAYRLSIEKALNINIPQGESRPDIWLTQEEYDAPRVIAGPYWIICITGEKGWGCKMYPFDKWQKFIDQNPDKLFVQIGTREDDPPRLQGKNVIDYVGKTQDKQAGIRDLYKLFLNAEGSIGLVSFHMHLSGALYKPAIIVAGAREPVHFTRYPGHAYLSTDGMLPCAVKACWHCALSACTNLVDAKGQGVEIAAGQRKCKEDSAEFKALNDGLKADGVMPRCVHMIEPEDLTRAINGYYAGGRLKALIPSDKPKLKNIVPTPAATPAVVLTAEEKKIAVETYGLSFGGGALREDDLEYIKKIVDLGKVKTVLEFGAGLSTLLLADMGLKVTTYETSKVWRDRLLKIKPDLDIRMWDGISFPVPPAEIPDDLIRYDLAFVDGPSGGDKREAAVAAAAALSDRVIVHDGWDEWEKKWQAAYLAPSFKGPYRNKGRCYFWDKTGAVGPVVAEKPIVEICPIKPPKESINSGVCQKHIKIVSTARGWGGCARSITTIMKLLIKAGHKVEFIPFRNAVTSSEMKAVLNGDLKDVKVTGNYDTLKEHCDVLLVYADDYVWEFNQPAIVSAFENIGADKKIMMLNYRRGAVGSIPWTKGWDKYMFLNSIQERDLLKHLPGVKTKVLPPCTDLEPFFKVKPDYNHNLRVVRHSSQGDTKFDKDFNSEVISILNDRKDAELFLLPGPSFLKTSNDIDGIIRCQKYPRTADPEVIAEFLGKGNLFWYSLPIGYMDMGPRVILEAMAAGLPVVADNWGGAVDRVKNGITGFLCDAKDEHIKIMTNLTAAELKRMGEAGRERAFSEFRPEAWIREIVEC